MDTGESSLSEVIPPQADMIARDWFYLNTLLQVAGPFESPVRFLDLGAGHGASKAIAERVFESCGLEWTGVDIGDSDEHMGRPGDAPRIDVYDGTDLPYNSERFDVIWCKQVLEHVRNPDAVIAEVARTLRPGGYFIGSVSQLEPYHSRSLFNWTHYGIRVVFRDHGLTVRELRPGADGLLLMMRAVFGYKTGLNEFFKQDSPLQVLLRALFTSGARGAEGNQETVYRQNMKIAGHIHFLAQKGL